MSAEYEPGGDIRPDKAANTAEGFWRIDWRNHAEDAERPEGV